MLACRLVLAVVALVAAAGCSQTTYKASTFRRTVTTNVVLHTNVPAEVSVSDRSLGTTPLSFPFTYEEEVDRRVGTAKEDLGQGAVGRGNGGQISFLNVA